MPGNSWFGLSVPRFSTRNFQTTKIFCLLDNAEVAPTSYSTPHLQSWYGPFLLWTERADGTLVPNDTGDPGASASGAHPIRSQVETLPYRAFVAPTAVANPSRAKALAALLVALVRLDPSRLRSDHVSALLSLLLEGLSHDAILNLLNPSHSPEWRRRPLYGRLGSPTYAPPRTYPLSADNMARDRIVTLLCVDYTMHENATRDARALLEFAAVAIPTETFIAHTEECFNLTDEEMAVNAPSSPHLFSLSVMTRPRFLWDIRHITIPSKCFERVHLHGPLSVFSLRGLALSLGDGKLDPSRGPCSRPFPPYKKHFPHWALPVDFF
jgi:hypothetical protein